MSARSRAQLDRANARIAELEQAASKNQEFKLEEVDAELDALEKRYTELLIDGKNEEAAQLRGQIRGIERRYATAQAVAMTSTTQERAVDAVRLDDVISQLEDTFPFLNPDDETYNDDVAQEILDLQEGLIRKGYPASIAMQRAASYVLNSLDIEWEGEDPEDPEQPGQPQPRSDDERRRAVKRGLEAISRQPPTPTGATGAPGTPREVNPANIGKMSQKDFNNLSEEQLKKLRGDDFDGGDGA